MSVILRLIAPQEEDLIMAATDILISTDTIEPALRNDYWREVTRPFCDTTPMAGGAATLEGTMRIRTVAGLTLGSTSFNAQRYTRDKWTIARSSLDHYLVHVLVAGSIRGDFAGRGAKAAQGGICIIDLSRPYTCEVDAGVRLATTVPRAGIDKLLGARDMHGFVLDSRLPITRLLVNYLQGLHAVSAELSTSEDVAVQEALLSLLSAGLAGTAPARDEPKSVLGRALRARTLAFIETHLADPRLGPDLLMQRFCVSRAHLYRAFAELGGIVQVIKTRRLDAVFTALADPRKATRPVARIAADCGFPDTGKFRKAFVARFGMTPQDARERGSHAAAAPDDAAPLSRHFAAYGTRQKR